ncbi:MULTISPECIES: M23 family metallopeptidase [Nocardioides]|uniref:Murein DD-endopeptidase MepM and murein hydrolase activator NlpD, contain LysM domain n=1 Tax=Nocardioides lianchengensis TaxID=1045774 RepID=A0A1G6JVH2_9ACTN|nr:M23 family metallopeptidase [Nocardioides lianchengensis]NYG08791.1 murein DD-endopeptidase MepM/ murein hydrolase activator NlpD [Nocardioides lianchengensis]SDC22631.1 Murein DD-endopeptidase MepM and murein hydrolase activator NlpD, contain LysM domain [Nocardioides lianchengensis]
MRYFPSASRPRLSAAVLACALAIGAMAVPLAQAADDDLKGKQDKVEQQIEHAHDDLEHSSKEVRRATARLEAAQAKLDAAEDAYAVARAKLTAAQARDTELRTKLAAAEQRLTEARADLTAGEQAVKDQRARFVDRVTGLYVKGDPRLLGLSSILAANDPNDLLRRVQANDTVIAKEDAAYDELRSIEVLLRVRETQVEDAQQAVAEQQAAAAAHVETMETLTAGAATAKEQVAGLFADARAARREAGAAQERDRLVLRQLKKREARIKQQILAAARRAARRGGGYTGESDGFLSSPVKGARVTSPFGYREHPIYHYWGLHDGTDFGAGCGTPLRAVADGTVMQAYWSSVYGNRLYVNVGRANGKFLTAVYNHATRYTVGPGERVRRGEVIGYVGSTGWSTGCHLHFTVLANGDPVNPMDWI